MLPETSWINIKLCVTNIKYILFSGISEIQK